MPANLRFDRAFEPYRPESASLAPRDVIVDPQWNVRDMTTKETQDHIDNLKASILDHGVERPIDIRWENGKAHLVDGLCRWTAVDELWKEGHRDIFLPAVRVKGDEAEMVARMMSSNSGRPLDEVEIAEGIRRLEQYGWSVDKIAVAIAKPRRYVTEALALAVTPLAAKQMVKAREVTAKRAIAEVEKHGDAAVPRLREEVGRKRAEAAAKGQKAKPVAREKKANPSERLLELADELAVCVLNPDSTIQQAMRRAEKYQKARLK